MRPLFNPSCEMGSIAVCIVKRCWIMYTVITRIAHQVISVAKVHNSSVIFCPWLPFIGICLLCAEVATSEVALLAPRACHSLFRLFLIAGQCAVDCVMHSDLVTE